MHTPWSSLGADHEPTFGLTDLEYFDVAHAARSLAGTWCVQADRDDRGQMSVSIVGDGDASDGGDLAPVFLLWREGGRLQLGYGQGDFYAGLGTHPHVEAAMVAARGALEGSAAVARWMDDLSFPSLKG